MAKKGAGLIPFARVDGKVKFLFHRTFTGSRAGLLVDFGGGTAPGESHEQTAIREFTEETDAMFLSPDYRNAGLCIASMDIQMQRLAADLRRTQDRHPHWWCKRNLRKGEGLRDWKTFFVEVDYRDVSGMNEVWAADRGQRFHKRRELLWVGAGSLLDVIDRQPEGMWRRLVELQGLRSLIKEISLHFVRE
jgi:hypothetical protein